MLNRKVISLFALASTIVLSWQLLAEVESVKPSALGQSAKQDMPRENPLAPVTVPQKSMPAHIADKSSANRAMQTETVLSPIDRIKAIQEKTALHDSLIQDHDTFTRYPSNNQRIESAEQDPVEKRYGIDERSTQSENGDTNLTIWTDKKFYLRGTEAIIFATLQDANGLTIPTQFLGQLIYNETESLSQFEFSDTDQDGVYEYRLSLGDDDDEQILIAGLYKVLIINDTNELTDAATFTLSQPELQLTGNYTDAISAQGNLLIQAEIEVTVKNRFYFQASLYSSSNDPIGSTQHSAELSPGRYWIPLEFDGLMLHDAEESGPYLLKSVSLTKVAIPIQRAPIIYPKFYTKDYSLDQFRNANYAVVDALP